MTLKEVLADIKAKQEANPKFQEFMAAIEKRKAEMAAKAEAAAEVEKETE